MRRFWKWFFIVLGSLVGLTLLTVCVLLWLVFTPARLTPLINKQLPSYVTCDAHVERVELTFFRTFPRLGMRIQGLQALSPAGGAPTDTLARVDLVTATVDVRALIKRKELLLSGLSLERGRILLYTDADGRTNFDVMRGTPEDDKPTPDDEPFSLGKFDLNALAMRDISVRYQNRIADLDAAVEHLSGDLAASWADSVAAIKFSTSPALVSFWSGGEHYLSQTPAAMRLDASADVRKMHVDVRDAWISVNGLELFAHGTAQADLLRKGIQTDLWYKFEKWPLSTVLGLVPVPLEGISASGELSSEGTVKGLYNDTHMPMIDATVQFANGNMTAPAYLPWKLSQVELDARIQTDLTDSASTLDIRTLHAHTPRSWVRATGSATHLFTDPYLTLNATLAGSLSDARSYFPAELKVAGTATGSVSLHSYLSDLQNVNLNRIHLAANMRVRNLNASYALEEPAHIQSPDAQVYFSLPNLHPSAKSLRWARLKVDTEHFDARMSTMLAAADALHVDVECPDMMHLPDGIPPVAADFAVGKLSARMDSDTLALANARGHASITQQAGKQKIKLLYGSDAIHAKTADLQAALKRLDVDADVLYDPAGATLAAQFIAPAGHVSLADAVIHTAQLNYPVEIPALAMHATPDRFDIDTAHIRLDESDFALKGRVWNIAPHIKGDSVLRAVLDFSSPTTNVSQLLALTSGIGSEEEAAAEKPAQGELTESLSGPYMVPQGVDIELNADIGRALWYAEPTAAEKAANTSVKPTVFSDIHGQVRVRDSKMYVAPEISFSSPATDGSLMFIYETPRPNHLFAGVALHLHRIEVAELLGFIPDLDELMPMLRGLDGRAEFHLAASGNMDSLYRFKLSTLRGTGSLAATDIVLKDKELYDQVAFLLKRKDHPGELRVDSLSAEFTILRDKVDLYPFLLSMDRYKVVVSGWQRLSMAFDYNISLVQSPLPFRASVDIKSKPNGDMKFKLAKARYPDFYRPNRRGVVENQEAELRRMIRESLINSEKRDSVAIKPSEEPLPTDEPAL